MLQPSPPLPLTFHMLWSTLLLTSLENTETAVCQILQAFQILWTVLYFVTPVFISCLQLLLHPFSMSPPCSFSSHAPAKLGFSHAKDTSYCFLPILVREAHFCFWLTLFSWLCSVFWFCNSSASQMKCTMPQPINFPMQIYPWQDFTCLKILLLRLWKS